MKNNEDITQLIDRYLSGDLNAAELAAFEKQLATDVNLAKELELERVLQKAIFDDGLLGWKQAIQLETTSIKKQKRVKMKDNNTCEVTISLKYRFIMYNYFILHTFKNCVKKG